MEPERSINSDSDFEKVAPRTLNAPNRVNAVEASAAGNRTDALLSQADRFVSLFPHRVAPRTSNLIISYSSQTFGLPVPVLKTAVKVCVASDLDVVGDAKASSNAAAAPAYSNKQL